MDEVLKKIDQLKKRKHSYKNLEIVRGAVQVGHYNADQVYDHISDDKETFDDYRNVFDDRYFRSMSSVRLEAFIPSYSRLRGSCLITFRSLKIRDCMFTLNHEQILSNLFEGLHTDPSLNLRGFITFKSEKKPDIYYIDLENNRFPLTKDETQQLCEIVDDFARIYIKSWQDIEKSFGTYLFQKAESVENGYRLIQVKRSLWKSMIDFSFQYDFEKGNSEWHIFDNSWSMIKVYSKTSTSQCDEGYHAFLEPEAAECYDYCKSDDGVWIVWDSKFLMSYEPLNIGSRGMWDALTTYTWLVNDFIPYVVFQNAKGKILKRIDFEKFRKQFKIEDYGWSGRVKSYRSLGEIANQRELYELIADLQNFFNSHSAKFFVTASDMKSLYESLILCLSKTPNKDFHYVYSKLKIKNKESLESVLAELNERKNQVKDKILSSLDLDYMLRPLVVLLRDNKSSLTKTEIQEIVIKLTPFVDLQNLTESIERARLVR